MLDTNVRYSNLCGVTSSKDNKYDTQLKFDLKRPPIKSGQTANDSSF